MTNNDFFLFGKRMLYQKVKLSHFVESIELRIIEATKRMDIPKNKISVKCFCSVDKESFMIQHEDNLIICMDKHQIDQVYSLSLLFYIYDLIDIKQPFFMLMYNSFPHFDRRLSYSLLILQAEKCFLAGNLRQSLVYIRTANELGLSVDPEVESGAIKKWEDLSLESYFTYNYLLLKGDEQNVFLSLSLNFFVFHEFAHAKFYLDQQSLTKFTNAVVTVFSFSSSINVDAFEDPSLIPKIPLEECVCDTYALYLLFDYMYEQNHTYSIKEMIDSYFVSVLNLSLISSNDSSSELMSDADYVYAAFRGIYAIEALRLLWGIEHRSLDLVNALGRAMIDSYQRFKNLLATLQKKWSELYNHYHISNDHPLSSEEEENIIAELIDRFSKID